jgi:hypothetical protein
LRRGLTPSNDGSDFQQAAKKLHETYWNQGRDAYRMPWVKDGDLNAGE